MLSNVGMRGMTEFWFPFNGKLWNGVFSEQTAKTGRFISKEKCSFALMSEFELYI
jgi:hypothetical protein